MEEVEVVGPNLQDLEVNGQNVDQQYQVNLDEGPSSSKGKPSGVHQHFAFSEQDQQYTCNYCGYVRCIKDSSIDGPHLAFV